MEVIKGFLFASGLSLNLSKSELIGCNIDEELVKKEADDMGVAVGKLPMKYLGVPLGGNQRRKAFWQEVLKKMNNRLMLWNSRHLSLAGRLVLCKAVLNAIPTYFMAIYKAPIGIVEDCEKMMRRFIWGAKEGARKVAWVSWSQLCKGIALGGMGLSFLGWKNRAMLLKWAWRFGSDKDAFWRKIVVAKYGWDARSLFLHKQQFRMGACSSVMQDIITNLLEDSMIAREFRENLCCAVGDGHNTQFWQDIWVGDEALLNLFPRVFVLSSLKNQYLDEQGNFMEGRWIWSMTFRRQFFGWELEEYSAFLRVINSSFPSRGNSDRLIWRGDRLGVFSVKRILQIMEEKLLQEDNWQIPQRVRKVVPAKITLFLWQLMQNRVATKDNCIIRGMHLEDEGLCSICGQALESASHLFLFCDQIWKLWIRICCREGLMLAMQGSVEDWLLAWNDLRVKSDSILWELIPYSLLWSIWLARNAMIFQQREFMVEEIWDMHITRISWWIKASGDSSYSAAQYHTNFVDISLPRVIKIRPQTTWMPPNSGCFKINVDGASKGAPGPSGIGGVVRDNSSKQLGYFSINTGILFAYEAEVLAVLKALQFAQQFHLSNFIIESDSSLVVGWVNFNKNRPWKLLNEFNLIDYLIETQGCLAINHIRREGNTLADHLANCGVGREGDLWFWDHNV